MTKKPRSKGLSSLGRSRRPSGKASAQVDRTRRELAAARRELKTLYVALDSLKTGLLLLDGDLRAVYSNPELRGIFKHLSPEQIRKQRPPYRSMLEAAVTDSRVKLDDYVERRLAWVRSGDPTPMDIPMADGSVLRSQLATLPGGGRMLIFSDVTDIVRTAEEMKRLATIDGMTGIYNRRHFLLLADHEWKRAQRYQRPVAFLMIDIDHFKEINDSFGHEAGDRMIVHLANMARDCKRESDVLARIGGEEFALLLPETTLDQAMVVAERLRQHVLNNPLSEISPAICASVSIGVATEDAAMRDISDLMKAADQALYCAKRAGRNRVICSVSAATAPALQDVATNSAESPSAQQPQSAASADR
jgi:diguanylate cyclase (GGDEF)-like protein